jgi:hypothetical protein
LHFNFFCASWRREARGSGKHTFEVKELDMEELTIKLTATAGDMDLDDLDRYL